MFPSVSKEDFERHAGFSVKKKVGLGPGSLSHLTLLSLADELSRDRAELPACLSRALRGVSLFLHVLLPSSSSTFYGFQKRLGRVPHV
jgi:hypothetical protein